MRQKAAVSFAVFFILALFAIAVFSLGYPQVSAERHWPLRSINTVEYSTGTGDSGTLSLPSALKGLPPRTAVTVTALLEAGPGESLFVKSVFAPLRLYINGELVYTYGQLGTYPPYMNDPPTGFALVPLPQEGGSLHLRAEYESLTQRNTLSLPAFYVGEHAALLNRILRLDGFSFLFSLLLIFLGLIMTGIALAFVRRVPSGAAFFWLGLFSLSAGVWVLGECDFASWVLPYPSLLYAMAYLGLFSMTIPFLRFGLLLLNPARKLPIQMVLLLHYLSLAGAILLQLFGLVDFTKSLFWFHVIAPIGFVSFSFCLLWEGLRNKNPAARRFAPAVLVLAFSTLLELVNYWFGLGAQLTVFFQVGVLAFVLSLGAVSGQYVGESMRNAAEKARLEYEMAGMERQISLQRLQFQRIAEKNESIKIQHHDLRHHLAALRSMASDTEELHGYLDGLAARIPAAEGVQICENFAVNAVAAHYFAMAEEAGIDIAVNLAVPQELDHVVESDLCVVVGNLMENAVEACARMTEGKKFIRVDSHLAHDILTLAVDNSFAGKIRRSEGAFLSSKGERRGMGISSVAAVAKKHSGNARFAEKDGVFQASLYICIA